MPLESAKVAFKRVRYTNAFTVVALYVYVDLPIPVTNPWHQREDSELIVLHDL